MPKLQQTKYGQFMLSLPAELVKAKKWVKGQTILMAFNERGNVELGEVG